MSFEFDYNRDLFIFGNSLEIPNIGKVRFLSYMEYVEKGADLSLINMDVLHIYYQYKKLLEDIEENRFILESLKNEKLFDIIRSQREFSDAYVRVFSAVLDESDEESLMKALELIFSEEEAFTFFRRLVLDMQMLVEEKVSPNPEIQKGIEISRKMRSEEGEPLTFVDVITSIVAGTSNSFEEVRSMTTIQIQAIFQRLGAFKNYDTSTLFATVSSDVKIESWSKKINLYEKEEYAINKSDFDKKYGGLFN